MAVNFSEDLYLPCQDTFGQPANFAGVGYNGPGRGIYKSDMLNVILEDGSIITNQQTIFDIRAAEFPSLPVQEDTVDILMDPLSGVPAIGLFQITDVWHNGGGEVTLQLRAVVG